MCSLGAMVGHRTRSIGPWSVAENWFDDRMIDGLRGLAASSLDRLRTFCYFTRPSRPDSREQEFDGETASAADPFVKSGFRFPPPASAAECHCARSTC